MTKFQYEPEKEFQKKFKKLAKKFRTLEEDLEVAKKNAIELYHDKNVDNDSVELITKINNESIMICKLKKFACKSLKGKGVKSGIRIIYAFKADCLTVHLIEIYFKPNQANEDKDLIKKFIRVKGPLDLR